MKKVFSIKEAQAKEAEITIGDFFLTLLHSATNTHILHLQSRSYSEHKALGEFYEEIVDLYYSIKPYKWIIYDLYHQNIQITIIEFIKIYFKVM